MKHIRYTCMAMLLCMLTSCQIVGPLPYQQSWGYLTANVKGKNWKDSYKNAYQLTHVIKGRPGSAIPCQSDFLSLTSHLYNNMGRLKQELTFIKVPLARGKYRIVQLRLGYCQDSDPVYAYLQYLEDDVVGARYDLFEKEENYIEIEEYNPATKELKGRFQMTVVFDNHGSTEYPGDTLRFTNGQFHTRVID
jgi:hypothetical protein